MAQEQLTSIERLISYEEMEGVNIEIVNDRYNRAFRITASVVGHPGDLLLGLHKVQTHIETMKRLVAGGRE